MISRIISREDIYHSVWEGAIDSAAEQFGVSAVYLMQICALFNVPVPSPGYWKKLAAGKQEPRTPLPPPRPGDPESWFQAIESHASPMPDVPPTKNKKKYPIARNAVHRLIRGARAHFEAGRPVEKGAYLKPYKKLLVDVTTSRSALLPALELANMLFNALEASGYRVILASVERSLKRKFPEERETGGEPRERWQYSDLWNPTQPTIVYVGDIAIGLSIVEMSERVMRHYSDKNRYVRESEYVPPRARSVDDDWMTTRVLPFGRFRIMAYSPYERVDWCEQWQDTKTVPLRTQIRSIVLAIEAMAPVLIEKVRQADHEAEIRHQERLEELERWRREEDRKRVAQSVVDSQRELQEIIGQWSHVISIEQFLKGVRQRAECLPDEDKEQILLRLDLARTFIGAQDPLDFFRTWKTPEERYAPRYTASDDG